MTMNEMDAVLGGEAELGNRSRWLVSMCIKSRKVATNDHTYKKLTGKN